MINNDLEQITRNFGNKKSKQHYTDHRTRLRNRFLEQGINNLQDYEIVELFLTFVIPHKDVKPAAKLAIEKFGTIKGFFDADEKELSKIPYFKEKALTLRMFIKEVALLYQKQQVEQIPVSQSKDDLIQYCKNKLGFKKDEEFWIISLDSKHAIINENLISKGLTDKTPVYPRQVLETAMKNSASSILLLHNHPNGNPEASEQDKTITKAIDIPARVLNISIYDHIIVAGENYFSFREQKLI
jgi:DNA repair protein RadC